MKNILIVDDSPLTRGTVRNSLELHGWAVCGEAENGADGIVKAQQLHPDLIVPLMDGIEAARVLKRLMPAIPIAMVTTFVDPYIEKGALAAGLDAFLDKSDSATTLIKQYSTRIRVCTPSSVG
jgi:two-component system chemotaxis response regulator CheY